MIQRFDVTSQEFKENPFPTLARMREAGPVVRTKLPIIGKVWLVTTYEAVNELLRNHNGFVRDARNTGKSKFADMQWWISKMFRAPAQNMLAKDEPDHRRLRGLVDGAFVRRSVEDMRGRVYTLADEILDQAVEKAGASRSIDFLEFSRQFPLAVICELRDRCSRHASIGRCGCWRNPSRRRRRDQALQKRRSSYWTTSREEDANS